MIHTSHEALPFTEFLVFFEAVRIVAAALMFLDVAGRVTPSERGRRSGDRRLASRFRPNIHVDLTVFVFLSAHSRGTEGSSYSGALSGATGSESTGDLPDGEVVRVAACHNARLIGEGEGTFEELH